MNPTRDSTEHLGRLVNRRPPVCTSPGLSVSFVWESHRTPCCILFAYLILTAAPPRPVK